MPGWSPRYSLDDGLKEIINWITENRYIYKPEKYN
jgi:hypothetical protein